MTWFQYEGRPNRENSWEARLRRSRCINRYAKALRKGRLVKPTVCPVCGKTVDNPRQMHGHHADYSKPLEVAWACYLCHLRAHREWDRLHP